MTKRAYLLIYFYDTVKLVSILFDYYFIDCFTGDLGYMARQSCWLIRIEG